MIPLRPTSGSWLLLLALGLIALPACGVEEGGQVPDPSNPAQTEDMNEQNSNLNQIDVLIEADPTVFPISDISAFKISISATNRGSEEIDPELNQASLFINGQDSLAWNETIGNGRREEKWFALPSGESVSMSWSTIGRSLFPTPGDYTLELHYGGRVMAPIQVQVLPD
jgi:hypothetical protein